MRLGRARTEARDDGKERRSKRGPTSVRRVGGNRDAANELPNVPRAENPQRAHLDEHFVADQTALVPLTTGPDVRRAQTKAMRGHGSNRASKRRRRTRDGDEGTGTGDSSGQDRGTGDSYTGAAKQHEPASQSRCMESDVRNVRRYHAAGWLVLLLPLVREHVRVQLNHNNQPNRAISEDTKMSYFALLLLPVASEPGDYTAGPKTNGFDAPVTKRTRHSSTRTRRKHTMTPEQFDVKCRDIAREEILKTLRLAEAIENEGGGK